ncbi:MAG: hypothetical protein J6T51_01520 [Kiritimatiellae bacterium]|nr:hypothetical protein [Kiritimatiellia bacterium]
MSRRRSVSVADDPSAFRQRVRMAAVQVAGLRPDELEMALAYEVEPSSGIPASEAEISFRLLADDDPTVRVYEVAVRRRVAERADAGGRFLRPLAALGALVVLLVAVDAVRVARTISALSLDVATCERLDAKVKAVQREAKSARDEARALRAGREAAQAAREEVARMRSAWPRLLRSIAQACGDRAVLTSLVSDGSFRAKFSATTVSPRVAADVMVELSRAAAKVGWRVEPGSVAASERGSTTSFDCEVVHD